MIFTKLFICEYDKVQFFSARWMNIGFCCIGLARFMAQVAAPVLSATWFKAEQRTTATAIAVLMPQLGMSLFSAVGR